MIEETVEIPKILLETLTTQGYFRLFYALIQQNGTNHRETYEFIEVLREKHGFPRKYDNYQVFRSAKHRFFVECGLMEIKWKK